MTSSRFISYGITLFLNVKNSKGIVAVDLRPTKFILRSIKKTKLCSSKEKELGQSIASSMKSYSRQNPSDRENQPNSFFSRGRFAFDKRSDRLLAVD